MNCKHAQNPDECEWCELNYLREQVSKLERELHTADQAASDNADWFNALVNDLAEILGCEKKPTAIIAACKQLKTKTVAAMPNKDSAT